MVSDSLGSISAITDAAGNLVESLSYDPWGRRRNPNNWTDYNISSTLFDRGFTGHEHLPQFGLINMNGRVYDPFLARFLSPDPFIQAPTYTQNYNRYSYAWNNPLKFFDPSGYINQYPDEGGIPTRHRDGGSTSATFAPGSMVNVWNGRGGFGPGSGRHWSDRLRTPEENFERLNPIAFNRLYGTNAYQSIVAEIRRNAESGRVGPSQNINLEVYGFWYVDGNGNPITNSLGISGEAWAIETGYFDLFNYISALSLRGNISEMSMNGSTYAKALWNFIVGGAGTLSDIKSNGLHNSLYWKQKNGKVTLTKNIRNNYLLKRSYRIAGESLHNGKMIAKSVTQLNIAFTATDYAFSWAVSGVPTFGQGMDLFFASVAAIPGAGWAISGGYWVISSGTFAITGKWMSEHMDNWVY